MISCDFIDFNFKFKEIPAGSTLPHNHDEEFVGADVWLSMRMRNVRYETASI